MPNVWLARLTLLLRLLFPKFEVPLHRLGYMANRLIVAVDNYDQIAQPLEESASLIVRELEEVGDKNIILMDKRDMAEAFHANLGQRQRSTPPVVGITLASHEAMPLKSVNDRNQRGWLDHQCLTQLFDGVTFLL